MKPNSPNPVLKSRLVLFPVIIAVSVMVFTIRLWQLQVAPTVQKERQTLVSSQQRSSPSFIDRARRKLVRMFHW